VYFFPRHVIIGCIGGIGIFIMTTGIEVSADHAWSWDPEVLVGFLARYVTCITIIDTIIPTNYTNDAYLGLCWTTGQQALPSWVC
jgi:MFS superfamily sulfate permease-like transporter